MTDIPTNDVLFWQSVVMGIQKLKTVGRTSSKPSTGKVLKREQTLTIPFHKNFHHTLELNTKADIDKQTFKRFKKEEFPLEGTLDLHGLTIDSAYTAVYHFIVSSYNQNKRTVLIVTGKGLEHNNQDIFEPKGSLKQIVPEWLKNDELKNMILTFIHPSPKLGGSGALYILLRRKKK